MEISTAQFNQFKAVFRFCARFHNKLEGHPFDLSRDNAEWLRLLVQELELKNRQGKPLAIPRSEAQEIVEADLLEDASVKRDTLVNYFKHEKPRRASTWERFLRLTGHDSFEDFFANERDDLVSRATLHLWQRMEGELLLEFKAGDASAPSRVEADRVAGILAVNSVRLRRLYNGLVLQTSAAPRLDLLGILLAAMPRVFDPELPTEFRELVGFLLRGILPEPVLDDLLSELVQVNFADSIEHIDTAARSSLYRQHYFEGKSFAEIALETRKDIQQVEDEINEILADIYQKNKTTHP